LAEKQKPARRVHAPQHTDGWRATWTIVQPEVFPTATESPRDTERPSPATRLPVIRVRLGIKSGAGGVGVAILDLNELVTRVKHALQTEGPD
jgi:hypothetical protein